MQLVTMCAAFSFFSRLKSLRFFVFSPSPEPLAQSLANEEKPPSAVVFLV